LDELEEPVLDALDRRIELLDDAINCTGGFKILLLPGKGDTDNLAVFRVRKITTDLKGNSVSYDLRICMHTGMDGRWHNMG
jgi:hypothetical protein